MFKPGQYPELRTGEEVLTDKRIATIAASKIEKIPWADTILEAGTKDSVWSGIRDKLKTSHSHVDPLYQLEGELLTYKRRIYIPDNTTLKLRVALECHDSKVAGHFGRDKTYELIKRNYYWPDIEAWIRNYVKTCDSCQRSKAPRHAKYGSLQPLEIPYAPFTHISMDFIIELPEVKIGATKYTKIWVIVDRFSKLAHFIPLPNSTAAELAKQFLRY